MHTSPAINMQVSSNTTNNNCSRKRRWYLLMENPSKTTHLGTLLRCAAAFNCHQVLLVGYDKFNCQGSFGSHLYLDIVVFPTWDSVYEYLRNGGGEKNENTEAVDSTDDSIQSTYNQSKTTTSHQNDNNPVTILGILGAYGGRDDIFSSVGMQVYEDDDTYASIVPPSSHKKKQDTCIQHRSFPIDKRPFTPDRDTCFMLSRYKNEFPASQARICNGFVHVPHLSLGETISKSNLMDTATILSITLHHYTAFAEYEERTFAENQKFVKEMKTTSMRRRLCRVYDQDKQLKQNVETESADKVEPESNDTDEHETKGAMMLFESPDAEASDY